MGYAVIHRDWEHLDEHGWPFTSHRGHPQLVYGEPYPSGPWIMEQLRLLFQYRRNRLYKQADAVRQWLLDYGMQVECLPDRVRVRW